MWSRTVTIYAKRVWPWYGTKDNRGVVMTYALAYNEDWDSRCSRCDYRNVKNLGEHGQINRAGGIKVCPGDYIIEHIDGTHEIVSEEEYKEMDWMKGEERCSSVVQSATE